MIIVNELPRSWVVTPLGQVCKLRNGYAFKSNTYSKAGIPVIRISDIGEGKVDLGSCVKVELQDQFLDYQVKAGDILVAMSGATTGKFGIYKNSELAFQNQRVGRFEILNESILDNKFLLYMLYGLKQQILDDAYGGAQPNISSGKIEEMEVPLPPFAEQLRIVARIEELFSDLDKGIETLRNAKEQLKVYRQAVLKYAFEGRLTKPDLEEGELPDGWGLKKIEDVAEIIGGIPFKSTEFLKSGKFQVIRMGNVRPGIIRYDESPVFLDKIGVKTQIKGQLRVNDVIITQTGTKGKRDYGFTALINKEDLLLNQRISAMRCNQLMMPKFLLYFTWTLTFQNQFFANETGNVGQGNVGIKGITKSLVPCPNLLTQNAIIQEIESRLSICDKIEASIVQGLQQAEALRQSILRKAFEGKLVLQDPNDEQALMLLERIKSERAAAQPIKKQKKAKV